MRVMGYVLILLLSTFPASPDHIEKVDLNLTDDEVAFSFLDLPDGEATLIQNNEMNVLINTGSRDAKKQLFERLEMYGVNHIDKLVLTNSKEAYTGNVMAVLDEFSVEKIISSKALLEELTKRYDLTEENIKIWETGKQHDIIPGVDTNVLYVTPPESKESALVVKFSFRGHDILYMGLADPSVEKKLSAHYAIDCEILKIGDFGEAGGTIPSFLKTADPQVAIVFHNEELDPKNVMIERLVEIWIDVYETKKNGVVTIKLDPYSYEVITIQTG